MPPGRLVQASARIPAVEPFLVAYATSTLRPSIPMPPVPSAHASGEDSRFGMYGQYVLRAVPDDWIAGDDSAGDQSTKPGEKVGRILREEGIQTHVPYATRPTDPKAFPRFSPCRRRGGISLRRGDVAARVVVAIVVVGTLFVLPDGFVDRATALAWTQTSQTDFEAGVAWNVDTAGSPGDVTLIPSPTDWIKDAANPVFEGQSAWDFTSVFPGTILHDGATYRMWFDGQGSAVGIGVATSPDGRLWTEDPANPIFTGTLGWESGVVVEPTVLREANGTYSMWYRGGVTGAAEIGKAWSPDGLSWTRWAAPVLLRTAPWESSALFQPSV